MKKKELAFVKEKEIIGLVEPVKVIGQLGEKKTDALFDTGATRTSVDFALAAKVGLGPVIKVKKVKKAEGITRRVVVKGQIEIHGKKYDCEINLADRKEMPQKVLVGREIIHPNFIVDVEKTHKGPSIQEERKRKKY